LTSQPASRDWNERNRPRRELTSQPASGDWNERNRPRRESTAQPASRDWNERNWLRRAVTTQLQAAYQGDIRQTHEKGRPNWPTFIPYKTGSY
jgi:hypothetical protein